MQVTIAIPLLNEADSVPELVRRLHETTSIMPEVQWNFLFIDDGSTDATASLLEAHGAVLGRYRIVKFSRNFGHQMAVTAALDHAEGDAVIILDADLQDPPELIPELLRRHHAGADVVYTYRSSREASFLLRTLYFAYYRILNSFSCIHIPLDSGDCALFSRRAVAELRRMPEYHRFIRGMRAWIGFRQEGVPLHRPARFAGRSKYSYLKLIRLGLDGIISFSVAPLRFAVLAGTLAIFIAVCFVLYAVYVRFTAATSPSGFTALLTVLTFFSGVQLLSLGVMGEYIGRIYEQGKRRPHYIVAEVIKSR